MSDKRIKHIAIFGAGLAGTLCALALANALEEDVDLTLVDTPGADEVDIFYGTATGPTIYEHLLNIGVTEPDLLPNTHTTFSVGTHYLNWGKAKRSWIQSLHKPLPIFHGVEFHHYLTRLSKVAPEAAKLELYIMSAHAAAKGVFAHPPEDKRTPLSNMEYGYHFSPHEWRSFLDQKIEASRINRQSGEIDNIEREHSQISAITLMDNKRIEAELYIDCTGPNSKITQDKTPRGRELRVLSSFKVQDGINSSSRRVTGTNYGWYSETNFRNGKQRHTFYDPTSEHLAIDAHGETDVPPIGVTLGYLSEPWLNNCLALGHSAAILEPLTPAPMTLLQRDIERLTELIPNSEDMSVEAREYNRRFSDDYAHGTMFQRGFFVDNSDEKSAYWMSAANDVLSPKLENKITQFSNRGAIVQFDLEPFSKEDWVQQHLGMGRLPRRYDPLADKTSEQDILHIFNQIRAANEALVVKMPPHDIYMKKLLEYFRKKYG